MRNDRPGQLPLARSEQLIVKEVEDEVLIYDLKTDQAHCLNKTAALVWKNCDGKNSVLEITASLSKETGVALDERVTWLALEQLHKFQLLEDSAIRPTELAGIDRRKLMKTFGVAALVLPLVISVVAPTVQAAQSPCSTNSRPNGCGCTSAPQCLNHNCVGGFCV